VAQLLKRRVLIISPNFPPINTPDHQRVRASLPYFQEFGWEPYVLALHPDVRPRQAKGLYDNLLEQAVPPQIRVTRVQALMTSMGDSSLALRCLPYLYQAGSKLIAEQKINVVYFSTTMFPVMALGPHWLKRFGVPYVLDFQDPWLSDYYNRPNAPMPPGGRFKYAISQSIARILEPRAMHDVSQIISVSLEYVKTLLERYSWLSEEQFTVLPFSASEKDFGYLSRFDIKQKIFDPDDGKKHWVYVGVIPDSMQFSLRALFISLSSLFKKNPALLGKIKVHFVGTNYASGDKAKKLVEPIAYEFGLLEVVDEHIYRVPYFEALRILLDSSAILMIGSDDPGYTASKLFPCILAKRPILAIFHENSSVVEILRKCNAGQAVTFNSSKIITDLANDIVSQLEWLLSLPKGESPPTKWEEFEPYTAREMARQQCKVFDHCLAGL
jgi:hypothetical protein